MEGEDVEDKFIGDLSQEHLEDKQEKTTINSDAHISGGPIDINSI